MNPLAILAMLPVIIFTALILPAAIGRSDGAGCSDGAGFWDNWKSGMFIITSILVVVLSIFGFIWGVNNL